MLLHLGLELLLLLGISLDMGSIKRGLGLDLAHPLLHTEHPTLDLNHVSNRRLLNSLCMRKG